jgi:hypothetical protein
VSEVTQEHLEKLMRQGYMIAAELATCRVSEDLASPALVGGYIMACVAISEQGYGVPSHRFHYSLL